MRKIFTFTMNETGEFANKVQSIKGLRLMTADGLKETKEFVEMVQELGSVIRAVNVPEDPEQEKQAIAMMQEGGIIVTDPDAGARDDIISEVKAITSTAVLTGQYDIAKRLLEVLDVTD